MKFEIINPSDLAFMEAGDYSVAACASLMVTQHHGLKEVDGEWSMPPFLFGNPVPWFEDTFGENIEAFIAAHTAELIAALRSFSYPKERTSTRNFVGYAHDLATAIEEKEKL